MTRNGARTLAVKSRRIKHRTGTTIEVCCLLGLETLVPRRLQEQADHLKTMKRDSICGVDPGLYLDGRVMLQR